MQKYRLATQLIGKDKLREDLWKRAREDPGKQTLRPRTLCQPSAYCGSNVRCKDAPSKPKPAVTKSACAHYLAQQHRTNKQTRGKSGTEAWTEQPIRAATP